MFDEGFQFSDLSYFLILALIPGIVETAKKWQWIAAGNRPLGLSLVLGFFLVGLAEAISLDLVPEVVLPWVRVMVMAMAGALSVSGSYDLIKKSKGNSTQSMIRGDGEEGMPTKAGRPCQWRGCPQVVRGDVPYCEEHAKQVAREHEADRPSAARRGYDGNWRKLRSMYLRRHPLCADPFGVHEGPVVATEVDHIQPLSRGGGHGWDNLQALCKSCHSKKTARESGFVRGKGDQIPGAS